MVDLVGIEPTTSSMPWKRAPSCATGPRLDARENGIEGSTKFILAHIFGIVNARSDQVLNLWHPTGWFVWIVCAFHGFVHSIVHFLECLFFLFGTLTGKPDPSRHEEN